jgi:DNA-binding NtrC family response regulator
MLPIDGNLKNKISILESLDDFENTEATLFKQKLGVLKDIALLLVEEIEALGYVRSVNITQGINLHEEMRMFEVHLVQSALERTGGHQTRAAQLLGISLTTLHNKLKRLNISPHILVDAPIIHEDQFYKNKSSAKSLKHFVDEQFSRLAA